MSQEPPIQPLRAPPPEASRDPSSRWLLAVALVAGALPYLVVLDAPLVFDDVKLVKNNELLRVGGSDGLRQMLGAFDVTSTRWEDEDLRPNYRPLRFLSYWIDYQLSRALWSFESDDPPTVLFHLQNLLWHVLNVALVFAISRRILSSSRGAAIAALFFAIHPLATEAVSYVSGRRDVLSTFFFLAAVGLYVSRGNDRTVRWPALVGVPILFACGLLTKEMVVTLPPLLLVLDAIRRPVWNVRRSVLHGLLWGTLALSVGVTLSTRGLVSGGAGREGLDGVWTAARYTARYFCLLLFPVSQSVDYSFHAIPPSRGLTVPSTTIPSVLLVLLLGSLGVFALVRRWGVPAVGLLWFLGTLVPVLQFVPTAEPFAERFAYLPSVGLVLIAAWLLGWLARTEPRAGWGLTGVLAVALCLLTFSRNEDWTSDLRLWSSAATAQPQCARAHLGHGNALKEAGRYAEAHDAYTRALEIWERWATPPPLHVGLALQARTQRGAVAALLAQDDPAFRQEAISDLERVLRSRDTDGEPIGGTVRGSWLHFELAGCYLKEGRTEDAEAEYRRVLTIGAPEGAVLGATSYLARMRVAEGNLDAALALFHDLVALLEPDDPRRVRVRLEMADAVLEGGGDLEAAAAFLEAALADNPSNEERVAILLRQARVLERAGELPLSVERLKDALRIAPHSPAVLVTLAGIEANRGEFRMAEERYLEVLRREPGHREAAAGLARLRLQERLSRGDESGGDGAEGEEVLRGLLAKARGHYVSGQLPAARQVYAELLTRAAAGGRQDLVAKAYVGVAEVEDKLRRPQEARAALDEALEAEPGLPAALLALGDLYLQRLGDGARAREYYERFLHAAGDPARTGSAAGRARAHLNLGGLLGESEPHAAIEHLEEARRLGAVTEPVHAASVDRTLGYLYARVGRWVASLDAFNRYLQVSEAFEDGERRAVRARVMAYVEREVIPRVLPPSGDASSSTPDRRAGGEP